MTRFPGDKETVSDYLTCLIRATKIIIFLVPRLCLGIHIYRALPGNRLKFRPIMEVELQVMRFQAKPGNEMCGTILSIF